MSVERFVHFQLYFFSDDSNKMVLRLTKVSFHLRIKVFYKNQLKCANNVFKIFHFVYFHLPNSFLVGESDHVRRRIDVSQFQCNDRRIRQERIRRLGIGSRRKRVHRFALRLVGSPPEMDFPVSFGDFLSGKFFQTFDCSK